MEYDVFISHASEDKDTVARPLAEQLELLGLRVWFDECQLTLGDSLRRNIDHGLLQSRFGIVVLSPAFFAKEWPNKELDGLVAREDGREKVILPISDKLAVSTSRGIDVVARTVLQAVSTQHDGADNSIRKNARTHEQEYLGRLRTQMLTAQSSWELRRFEYELDEHLTRYTHSPEGRLLKDQLQLARMRAETREAPRAAPAPMAYRPAPLRWLMYLTIGVLLGFLVYLLVSRFVLGP